MGSYPTGSNNDLLTIQTEQISFQIRGAFGHPKCKTPANKAGKYYIKIRTGDKLKRVAVLGVTNEGNYELVDLPDDKYEVEGKDTKCYTGPILYEESLYKIHAELNEGVSGSIRIDHQNQEIQNAFRPWKPKSGYKEITGDVNFKSNVGKTKFTITVDDDPFTMVEIELEVFPSKLDYQTDYANLLAEVQSITYNLIFDFLKKTYRGYEKGDEINKSPTEFFALLEHVFEHYLRAVDKIIYQPHHQLMQEHRVLPSYKIKGSDTQTTKWLVKHPQFVKHTGGSFKIEKALGVNKHVSYDTKENKFVKFILESTLKLMRDFYTAYEEQFKGATPGPNPYVKNTLDDYAREIRKRLHNTFLAEVDAHATNTSMSLVFAMAPGYADILKDYLLLLRGLNINLGLVDISVKDLWLVYEYWCFIKLNYILKYEFGYQLLYEKQDFINVDYKGIYVNMVKGDGQGKSTVEYRKDNVTIKLTYNDSSLDDDYSDDDMDLDSSGDDELQSVTTRQRPDNVFKLTKTITDSDGKTKVEQYIFDAKYRLYAKQLENKKNKSNVNTAHIQDNQIKNNDVKQSAKNYCNFGPMASDINTMHRYKDAIVSVVKVEGKPDEYVHQIKGAYILFPLRDEKNYLAHKFYQSISKVRVGGFPFLPDKFSTEAAKNEFINNKQWLTDLCQTDAEGQVLLRKFLWDLLEAN